MTGPGPAGRRSMQTTTSSRLIVLATLLGLTATGLTGCSLLGDDDSPPAAAATAPPDVLAGLDGALDRRSQAVRDHDTRGFLAGLAPGDRALRRQQRTYFDNLDQLPLGTFDYEVEPSAVVRKGDDYEAVVDLRTELGGFDERPVVSRDLMRFTSAGSPGQYVIAAASDPAWAEEHDVRPQPWDFGPILVRTVPGVLGIFDQGSIGFSERLLSDVRQGITDVSAVVPFEWSRSVVVYALSDPSYLASIPDLPGGDPRTLDGVAVPVVAEPGKSALASTRFVLHPRLLSHGGQGRARLIRHELTHVALGRRDDDVPVWLSEGLAEYVSVRPLPPERRGVSQTAVDAARAGFTDLPGDADFNADSRVHYGESWWACEYVAANFGEATLWSLLDQLDDADLDAAGRNDVLRAWIGLGTRQLAQRAGKLLLLTFDPAAAAPLP
jgi:hypothetical protein